MADRQQAPRACYLRVAVPAPLSPLFDYAPPPGADPATLQPGTRLLVPFGRGRKVAVLVETRPEPGFDAARIRPALQVLDPPATLPPPLLALARWAADYYVHPLGEVLHSILPPPARLAKPLPSPWPPRWRLQVAAAAAADATRRAPRQAALIERLAAHPSGLDADALGETGGAWRRALTALVARGLVEEVPGEASPPPTAAAAGAIAGDPPRLHDEQVAAVRAVTGALGGFAGFALEGVTGSGKTEVYLRVIEAVLARGGQALLLVPEIGLTPQLVARVRARFTAPLAVLHSGLGDGERYRAWCGAREGHARIVLGTRSAVFTPMPELALVVVDEEHDGSLKQQDGFRYHARDVAVMRAKQTGVPVLLGSATPSLETLGNVASGRYQLLRLTRRAAGASFPTLKLVDLRRRGLHEGLSEPLLEGIEQHLASGDQALIFLNQRGFAPTLLCHDCGWAAECHRCDARLTLHRRRQRLQCHHCGSRAAVPATCPQCASNALRPLGAGTERLEAALEDRFGGVPVIRVDRDSTRRRDSLQTLLAPVAAGAPSILVGTQMLAKGHHFPHVTLVGIVNADRGLYSVDFRAPEHLAQLVVQVAGRAGRGARPGEVLIQTHNPEHPLLRLLIEQGYPGFARAALAEREAAGLPPFRRLALLRAESAEEQAPLRFLARVRTRAASRAQAAAIELLGPAPAPLERLAGRYRAQLLLQSVTRRPLHAFCMALRQELEASRQDRRVRWSLDIDPTDTL